MWVMGVFTKVSGTNKLGSEMVLVYSFGQMDLSMRDFGKKIKPMGKEE